MPPASGVGQKTQGKKGEGATGGTSPSPRLPSPALPKQSAQGVRYPPCLWQLAHRLAVGLPFQICSLAGQAGGVDEDWKALSS